MDLSYTKILDLTPLKSLFFLKALNIAGTRVNDFISLKHLDSLELLSVRNCLSISSLNEIGNLITLRSLDVGHCIKISSIAPLSSLTRMEELILDSSGVTTSLEESLGVFSSLSELRVLNISNTTLTSCRDEILNCLHIDAQLEVCSRDDIFLQAAIENDINTLRMMIGSGQVFSILNMSYIFLFFCSILMCFRI